MAGHDAEGFARLAARLEKEEGIAALTDEHWRLIDYLRENQQGALVAIECNSGAIKAMVG